MFKKFMSKKRNKKRGFTLIELIIVIAIIAILAAIAVPAFGNISQKAKVNTDIANARTIYSVLTAAVAEGDTKVPTASTAAPIPTISGLDNKIKSKAISGTFAYTLNTTGDIVIYVDPADGSANVQIYPNGSAPYSD